jgi:hypothetical protein
VSSDVLDIADPCSYPLACGEYGIYSDEQCFFKIKAGALLYHLRRSSNWYITRRSEHHTDKLPNKNKHTRHTTPPPPTTRERRTKQVVDNCAVVTNDVPRQNRSPLQARTALLSSSTMGLSPSNHTPES